ncbi:MAG: sigma-70 family RNA polymerase sigma factor [Acidobacteria bacterium]|nr:sigma-70 family RNA polymerase sigma factor [Acidobacteriota bacterium]
MAEPRSFEEVVAAVYPRARAIALLACRDADAAQDLVQEALARAVRRPPEPLTEDVLAAWLRTTIVRLSIRRWRRAMRETTALLRLGREPQPAPAATAPTEDLLKALGSLSPRQRACIVLRYLEDLPEEEVGRSLGLRLGTVKAHLAQARARLRARLPEKPEAP